MGETRVDLLHLLEDLRDAYPGSLEETILTEIVANSLDSGACEIQAWTDPVSATLTVLDSGKGMSRQTLTRYHDLATTNKRRGRTIGFAGVGIKLGLLVSEEVVTEARRARTHLGTSWRLSSRTRAPWRWIEPPGLLNRPGTGVRLYLSNPLSPLLEPGRVEETLLSHFQPLLDPGLDAVLSAYYPEGVSFQVNGRTLPRSAASPGRVPVTIRVGRQRKPSGVGYLIRDPSLAEEFPSLAALVEQRSGGQKRLSLGGPPVTASRGPMDPTKGQGPEPEAGPDCKETEDFGVGTDSGPSPTRPTLNAAVGKVSLPGGRRSGTSHRYSLRVRFEERPEDPELGRLIESTIWVNTGHPAYLRAVASRSEAYHLALVVAMTLASLAVEPVRIHAFVTSFLARWGEASRR